jgi:hypothetical protein
MHRRPIFLLFSAVLLSTGLAGAQDYAVVHDQEDYVAFGVIDPGVAFTWEAQVQFDDLTEAMPRGYATLLEIVESDGINRLYLGIVNGNWQVESNDNNTTEGNSCADGVALCAPASLVEDVPYHLALTLDGAAFAIYVDGMSVFSGTLPSVPVFGSAQWVTGADTDDGVTFVSDSLAAKMDEVRLWAGVVPTSQLSCLGGYALTGTESGLISYWPMDEVPGTAVASDDVAGVNPGSLLGGAEFVVSPFGLLPSASGGIPCYDWDGDGYTPSAGDCDDTDASLNPGATELCDGIDNDCDFATDEDFDADGDGFTTCGADGLPGTTDDDCDDADSLTYPSAPEICDGLDNDCDGAVPAAEEDTDGDMWMVCQSDCDDMDAAVYPGATELCDAIDSDCDGDLLDGFGDFDSDGIADCIDADDDNDGDLDVTDCNDADAAIYNGAAEACDTIDSDCDGDFVDGFPDLDGDGTPDCTDDDVDGDGDPAATDCDDMDPGLYNGAPELCDGIDNDCDPSTWADADGEVDFDQDGDLSCSDCDDNDGANFGGNAEVCDGYDNDCNGLADFVSASGGDDDDSAGDDDDSAAPPPRGAG